MAQQMANAETETCPSCGAVTLVSPLQVTHRYLGSSPGCWATYGKLLAREYSDLHYMRVHALTVDAYAAQHPGEESPQTVSSINVHLASLMAFFDYGMEISRLAGLKQDLAKQKTRFEWPATPENLGKMTVLDVLASTNASEHAELIEAWARSVFDAWAPWHGRIRNILQAVVLDFSH